MTTSVKTKPAAHTPPFQAVYAVVARPDGREVRLRIGGAFPNRDGSLSVLLDALPTNGRLHICPYQPRDATPLRREESA